MRAKLYGYLLNCRLRHWSSGDLLAGGAFGKGIGHRGETFFGARDDAGSGRVDNSGRGAGCDGLRCSRGYLPRRARRR